ncbi:lyase family protein [Celeribacter sp.]|uniref:lyase family protein n=1 Tax=Celeribacter sp. TaxID=1890673 RepID=UPI003A901422
MTQIDTWSRTESDELGERRLPGEALYGINSLRASENFVVSGHRLGTLTPLVSAMAQIKKAAAQANARVAGLSPDKAEVIGRVCDELISGQHRGHFIVDVFEGGGGTSSHMNINEVVANRGLELMGYACGDYKHLHPVKDVNRSQSTTDVHNAAVRVALLLGAPRLNAVLQRLAHAFDERAYAFRGILKIGRTHLQDAVPMTLEEEFKGFADAINLEAEGIAPTSRTLSALYLGGPIAGTSLAAKPQFADAVTMELADITGLDLVPAHHPASAAWNSNDLVKFSGLIRSVAVSLSKICNDLRLLASGPRGGFGEITIPPVQTGSPHVNGKINPVIPEMVNQVAFHIIGTDVTIGLASEAGQLQRNAFEPLIAFHLLNNLTMLENAAKLLADRCVAGITANREACHRNLTHADTLSAGIFALYGETVGQSVLDRFNAGEDLAQLLRDISKE